MAESLPHSSRTKNVITSFLENGSSWLKILLIFLYIGLILRILAIPAQGFEADIAFWKSWGLAPYDLGIVKAREITNNNYPAPFSYFLWFITWVYSFAADPHNFYEY